MKPLFTAIRVFAAIMVLSCAGVFAQTCPSYCHKDDVKISSQSGLPGGWFVFYKQGQSGLWKSSLKTYNPAVIPNTGNDNPRSIDISEDGRWIVYSNYYGDNYSNPTILIRSDGQYRTELPTTTPNSFGDANKPDIVGFYRNSPKGNEIFFPVMIGNFYALQVTLPQDGAPTAGTKRKIADTGMMVAWWGNGGCSYGISGDRVFGLFFEKIGGREFNRSQYLTIPDNGNGTASAADLTRYLNDAPCSLDNSGFYYGCGQTMSWDGTLCLANSGWIGSNCLPNKKSTGVDGNQMDHKGFYITEFVGKNDPQVAIDKVIDDPQYGVNVTWCPPQYRIGSYSDVDFSGWAFSNNNEYVIGRLGGPQAQPKGIWVVHWPSATWHLVTPQDNTTSMEDPAMFITDAQTPSNNRTMQSRPTGLGAGRQVEMITGRRGVNICIFITDGAYARFTVDGRRAAGLSQDGHR